jgi:hypothetical protein
VGGWVVEEVEDQQQRYLLGGLLGGIAKAPQSPFLTLWWFQISGTKVVDVAVLKRLLGNTSLGANATSISRLQPGAKCLRRAPVCRLLASLCHDGHAVGRDGVSVIAFETWHAAALATAAERHLLRQSPQSHSHPNTILPGVDRHPPAPLPTVEPSDITREPPPSADESRAYQGVGLGLGLRRSLEPPEAREAGLLALGYAAAPRLVIGDVFHGGPAAGAQVPQKRGCQHGKKSLNART